MIRADETERAWADVLRRVRGEVLAVPARLRPEMTPAAADALDRELRAALASLGATMQRLEAMQASAMRALIPPPRLRLSEWIEREIRLPEGVSAQPGRVRLWPFQREIADAIGDPLIERVTLVKPVRVGFSTLADGAAGGYVANEPAPISVRSTRRGGLPGLHVSDLEPIFAESPAVADTLADDARPRNTLLSRRFPRRIAQDRGRPRAAQPATTHGARAVSRRGGRHGKHE